MPMLDQNMKDRLHAHLELSRDDNVGEILRRYKRECRTIAAEAGEEAKLNLEVIMCDFKLKMAATWLCYWATPFACLGVGVAIGFVLARVFQ